MVNTQPFQLTNVQQHVQPSRPCSSCWPTTVPIRRILFFCISNGRPKAAETRFVPHIRRLANMVRPVHSRVVVRLISGVMVNAFNTPLHSGRPNPPEPICGRCVGEPSAAPMQPGPSGHTRPLPAHPAWPMAAPPALALPRTCPPPPATFLLPSHTKPHPPGHTPPCATLQGVRCDGPASSPTSALSSPSTPHPTLLPMTRCPAGGAPRRARQPHAAAGCCQGQPVPHRKVPGAGGRGCGGGCGRQGCGGGCGGGWAGRRMGAVGN